MDFQIRFWFYQLFPPSESVCLLIHIDGMRRDYGSYERLHIVVHDLLFDMSRKPGPNRGLRQTGSPSKNLEGSGAPSGDYSGFIHKNPNPI